MILTCTMSIIVQRLGMNDTNISCISLKFASLYIEAHDGKVADEKLPDLPFKDCFGMKIYEDMKY